MPLITRQGKGEKLTIQEMDGNLEYLESLAQESITVNGYPNINNVIITPVSSLSYDPNNQQIILSIDTDPGYKAYRAKIAMQSIDWPGYGYLYNWYAVDSVLGLVNPSGGTGLTAPNEWRVPSNTDWDTLATFAGGTSVAGGKLKSTLNSTGYPFYGWLSNGEGTDDYNFSGVPGGFRNSSGTFSDIGSFTFWWSTSGSFLPDYAYYRRLDFNSNNITDNYILKSNGYSVRLVREATAGELLLNDGDTSDTSSLDPYTGNDGKTYVTVKIDSQIWLAQNLRETKYNDNSDIFNAAVPFLFPGGDGSNGTWEAKGTAQEGAWTAYFASPGLGVEYNSTTIRLFYNEVLENTFGEDLIWADSTNCPSCTPTYSLRKQSLQSFKKTHIKITHAYTYNTNNNTYVEKNLIIKDAKDDVINMAFIPYERDATGALTRKDLNNYKSDGSIIPYVYVEILEYQPESYYYSGALAEGIGVSNL